MRLAAALLVSLLALHASGAVDSLLEHLYGDSEDAALFTERFAERINKTPDLYRPPQLFLDAVASPLNFTSSLDSFAADSRLQGFEDGLALWTGQYALQTDCAIAELSAPEDLPQAADQVLATAARVQELQQSALSDRDTRALIKRWQKVRGYLAEPQPAALSGWERRRLRHFLERLAKADLAAIACAAEQAAVLLAPAWLSAVEQHMRAHPRAGDAVLLRRDSDLGAVIFTGTADGTVLADDVVAIFDLGGDDVYGLETAEPFTGVPQWLVDLAGDDRYESTRPGGIGSGIGRVSLLLDRSGNDRYVGTTYTQGFALLGAAVLIDRDGRDEYSARYHAQGAALSGLALLLDEGGYDSYRLAGLGQGLGLYAGLGMLADGDGNDRYQALARQPTGYGTPGLSDAWAQGVGLGLRGLSSGGLGLLLDGHGHDDFDAGVFAQGGGYYHGVGVLLDRGRGDDQFIGSRYAQAWGAHGGVGFFDNTVGNDRYRTRHSVNAGLAWDYSLAWFRDRAGDDDYQVGDFSLGASAYASLALFEDGAGADSYQGTIPARNNEGGPNLSVFVDRGPDSNRFAGGEQSAGCSRPEGQGFVIWNLLDVEPACP